MIILALNSHDFYDFQVSIPHSLKKSLLDSYVILYTYPLF